MFGGRGRLEDVPGVKTDARGGIPAHGGGRGDRVSSRIHEAEAMPCFKSDSRGDPLKKKKKLKKRERNLNVLCSGFGNK